MIVCASSMPAAWLKTCTRRSISSSHGPAPSAPTIRSAASSYQTNGNDCGPVTTGGCVTPPVAPAPTGSGAVNDGTFRMANTASATSTRAECAMSGELPALEDQEAMRIRRLRMWIHPEHLQHPRRRFLIPRPLQGHLRGQAGPIVHHGAIVHCGGRGGYGQAFGGIQRRNLRERLA